ncbi:polysaccharide pyruvyl transferase family protein [Sphingobium yanoikuyae]|uniref:polysaccharide pyruvyl transferase family protein n=1 Tax=Sphingobium yanoikuyae TaxID=13690 RepID=UPI0031DC76F3
MKLFYYRAKEGNFGDDLNGWLWEELAPGRWSDEADTLFCGIGTIIGNHMPPASRIRIFSSGLGYRPVPEDFSTDRWDVVALRGPLTARVLNRPDRAIADGALLLSTLDRLTPLPEAERGRPIFIPHYEAMDEGDWAAACATADVKLVDPRQCAHQVIDEIRRSRLVIADSMHAAIIADTLRVPWIPVSSSGGINSFKWLDWSLSLNLPYEPRILPTATLDTAYRDGVRRLVGEHYRLAHPDAEGALAHQRQMTRREQRGWWMSMRPKLKHHLLALPRRLPQPPAVARRIATWNRRQHSRIASALEQLKNEAGFLSDDRIFASRVDQLSVEFDKLVRSG